MSYSNEKDEIGELFGAKPGSRSGGYSDEIERRPPEKTTIPAKPPRSAGQPTTVVKQPVKLRPPAHVEPHPLDLPPTRPAATRSPAPSLPVVAEAPEPEVDDEELLVYDAAEAPDFSDFDLPPAEDSPVSKTSTTPAPRQTPAETFNPTPPPAAEVDPAPASQTSARPPASDFSFASDASLAHASKAGSLLETRGLVKIYDGRTVVNGVDIHVKPGEIVGLLGPNGAGKTTSFYMIVGIVPPNGGHVLFDGNDVTSMPMYKRARLGMGYLPQEESIFRKLTVEENIMAVMETLDLPRKERLARCEELLERFSITHIRRNVALTCSGGEKRRLTIARSLVTMPSLLMLDEPFSGVDPIAVNEIQGIVEDLRKSGLAILITDHNARQTLELVDRAYLIYEGRVLREGTRDFLINDPVSRELYLGDRFTM